MSSTLAGRAVLVTRPSGVAGRIVALLTARGGEAVLLPAIEILPPDDPASLGAVIDNLDAFDIAIFVSPTAVQMANNAVGARRAWPRRTKYAAVGRETAKALHKIGIPGALAPQGRGDSESLAALSEMAEVAGRRIVIFRGQGGRENLRETLLERGAQVEYGHCYRRVRPRTDVSALVERWTQGGISAVSVTSAEGLENLFAMLGDCGSAGPALLRATPVFVPHPRVGEAARSRGVERVIVTAAGDDALVQALDDFFARV